VQSQSLDDSAVRVSRVGLGCNNFGRRVDFDGTRAVVEAALDAGITFFDTADIYGGGDSERFLGEILKDRRDSVVLATKFGMAQGGGGTREYVRRAIDASLERLQTDYVDLYYYHRPDGVTPIAETTRAIAELVDEGKVRHIGISNVDATQVAEAAAAGNLAAVQNEYSLLNRSAEGDVLPRCVELGVGFVPYFPLAHGLLTGKYRKAEPPPQGSRLEGSKDRLTDEALERVDRLERFASEHGHSLLELAIGALASEPGVVSVIAGATKPEQVRANAAAGGWELGAAERDALRRL